MYFGQTPVRLNPDTEGEVVWATRIDPVRARIDSVPLPESGYRCRDVVLHDGAAEGYREVNGSRYGVFNVLELFEASSYSTYSALVRAEDERAVAAMLDCGSELDVFAEDWTASLRPICKACSEGTPHDDHDLEGEEEWRAERRIALAAPSERTVDDLLSSWASRGLGPVIDVTLQLKA